MALDRRTFMNAGLKAGCLAALTAGTPLRAGASRPGPLAVLDYARFAHHVERFNAMEPERPLNLVPNAQAWDWIAEHAPAFECPDAQVEEIYWYRWWTFRKALVRTPEGRVAAMEFYGRAPVSSAVGHHLMESRWLRDRAVAQDILLYWLRGGTDGSPPKDEFKYSGWTIWAAYQRWLVTGDTAGLAAMFDDFARYYEGWERLRMNADGSFWQFDVRDAMEESISGSRRDRNLRPPLNSYMYGNAVAMAKIARLTGRAALAPMYEGKAKTLRDIVQDRLWDEQAQFFKVRYVHPGAADDDTLCDAREEIGFIPWYFDLPDAGRGYEAAWAQLADPQGFGAPHGILTAERRHPRFRYSFAAACEWNGPVWPFATSQTLTALANVLCSGRPAPVSARDYFHALRTYARSQYRDGKPYIGEYLDGETGLWLHKDLERGRYYNHSTYCDLVINGLVGLRPEPGGRLVVQPQVPQGSWDWFCLDGVPFQGKLLTVLWDRDGSRYRRGAGLTVLADGERIARSRRLERLSARIG
ncbi:MGH1-like glycoside hydrolase domain-containing protein [Novosphingobium kaempferiae]|uniref:MGH1-like glycoside hydrolase domain-containing protein n=1 Tax=Novosphingobium kaempferiae TaxID=2896849 RepID=UPI001E46C992|nr:glycosyl hydrolase family 65 protein [Novosphingobium kaempferiae]